MDREIEGRGTADYLWNVKNVVPFLKVDKGLADEADGVQLMKPIPDLDDAARPAVEQGRLRHQDALGHQAGRPRRASRRSSTSSSRSAARSSAPASCRSSSPRSTSTAREKAEAEELLKAAILEQLDELGDDQHVMLKLTLPEEDDFYAELVDAPATCCGSSRCPAATAATRPTPASPATTASIASFSRALTEGLSAQQSDDEFDATLDDSIGSIYEASVT